MKPAPTQFCKCTCFSNYTIITLDQTAPPTSNSSNETTHLHTCNDCTKKFCLDSNLPICENATEDDVFTKCFQRDSAKDEAIVLIFIFATVGLLAWATVKPWVSRWRDSRRARHSYVPVAGDGPEGR